MKPEDFLANFGALANSSEGVNKLREMILALAMRGSLVPQDPQDQPAAHLLKDAIPAPAQLSAELGLTRSSQSNAPEELYPLPKTWAWVTTSTAFHVITDGDHQPPPQAETGIPFLVIGNVCTGRLNFNGTRFVPEEYHSALADIRIPRKGDLLYTVVGSYGVPVIVDTSRPFCVQRHIAILKPSKVLDVRYAYYVMKSPLVFRQATACATGTAQKTVPLSGLRRIVIPLPPTKEQKRIVAKVDQLMALCDELEHQQDKKQETGTRLTRSALDALTSAEGPEEFAEAWRRVTDNFDMLFAKPESVSGLRETILALAVQGRLVPQDSYERDVSGLATEIATARKQLLPRYGMRDNPSQSPVTAEEEPYPLPRGWQWLRLGLFGGFLGGGTPSKSNPSFWEGEIPWVSPKDMKKPYIDNAQDHISEAAVAESSVKRIPTGSLLFVVRGMILAHSFPTALTTREVTINQDMKALVLARPDLGAFLLLSCRAARTRILQKVARSSHGTCRLESRDLEEFPIALPPMSEQKRIIAKVDQLMALCDELESKLRDAEQGAQRLAEAMTAAMVS
jgi:type I restriction enzyme S subunit